MILEPGKEYLFKQCHDLIYFKILFCNIKSLGTYEGNSLFEKHKTFLFFNKYKICEILFTNIVSANSMNLKQMSPLKEKQKEKKKVKCIAMLIGRWIKQTMTAIQLTHCNKKKLSKLMKCN